MKKKITYLIFIVLAVLWVYRSYNAYKSLEEKNYCGEVIKKAEITGYKYADSILIIKFDFGAREIRASNIDFLTAEIGNTMCYSFSKSQLNPSILSFIDFFLFILLLLFILIVLVFSAYTLIDWVFCEEVKRI